MVSLTKITSRDLGEALKVAREKAGVTLDVISARTKISVRQLTALENGEFRQLPNQMFAKMFLRQYLDIIQEPPETWLQAFDAAWRRMADSSQTVALRPPMPLRKRRVGPWIVSLVLVAVAVAGVLVVERRQKADAPRQQPRPVEPRLTAAGLSARRSTPAPAPTTAPTPEPGLLVIHTGDDASWVEVRVAGESRASRLMPSAATWTVEAGGREVDLVLGNAGAVSIEYLGQARSPAGRPGEVAHIHLDAAPSPPAGR